MNNKHLVNIPIAYMKENDKKMNEMKQGIYKDIDGVHADLNAVKADVIEVNSKSESIKEYLNSIKSEVDNLPKVIEARGRLAEEVSNAYVDGKISNEESKRISDVLQAIKEAKGYTDVAKIGTEEYINSIKTEVIDYSDTLLHNLEDALGPLAWEDKVELARLGQTIIDGGYLKTELIKAHSIGSEKINTNELVVGHNIQMSNETLESLEQRSVLAETVSKAYADDKISEEEARSIQATLDALNAAKGYTDASEANAKSYADGKLIESIDYSDTLISQLEDSLGPLAWEDKVELARLGSTVIDGGYLKTELIKANSIGARHINTDELVVGDNITMGPNAVITWSHLEPELKENIEESLYRVEIRATNGNIFKNGIINTKLQAIVYEGETDITDTIDANRFRWTRISNDSEGDKLWNDAHFGGTKEVNITRDYVNQRATFSCEILLGE